MPSLTEFHFSFLLCVSQTSQCERVSTFDNNFINFNYHQHFR